MKRQNARLEIFLSLTWYEVALRFLFTFVAKTSEVLLAAGLVVSTTNFLTDGSILATHPGVSMAWAWAQALAIDSSLGVSLSYAFQCLKQKAWIRGALYGVLTLLLAGVAGGITTIDIVSHALHLPMNDAMAQMGINVAILSRLRAIAVIGFILMGRLRDLPMTPLLTKTETEPQPSLAPASGSSQGSQIQVAIQSLCSQFSAQEMAQILNACIAAKKIVLVREAPKEIPEPRLLEIDQQRQSHSLMDGSGPIGTGAALGEPEPPAVPPSQSEPASLGEPARKAPVAVEPPVSVEQHLWKAPRTPERVLQGPEPVAGVPSEESVMEQKMAQVPQDGVVAKSEPGGVPAQQRLEQAYQSLVAEGKRPSGRALAERAHVHRSTCVEWLKARQRQAPENTQLPEEPEHDGLSLPDELPDVAVMGLSGKALEPEIISVRAERSDVAMMELSEAEMSHCEMTGGVSSSVFPDSSLPEDTLDV